MTTQNALSEIFDKYHLDVTEEDHRLFIRRLAKKNKAISTDIFYSILGLMLGLFLGIIGSRKIGGLIIIPSLFYLGYALNLRARKKEANKTTLEIANNYLEVKNGVKRTRISFADISEFSNRIFDAGKLRVGKISVITEKGKIVEIIEVFGPDIDEDVIQEDLVQISNYIVDHYINEEEE